MDREDAALSEVGQTQKDELCQIPLLGGSQGQRVGGGRQGLAEGDGELVLGGDRVSVWECSGHRGWSWLHNGASVFMTVQVLDSRYVYFTKIKNNNLKGKSKPRMFCFYDPKNTY